MEKNYRCIIKGEKKKCKIKKKNECDKKAVIVTKEQTLRKEWEKVHKNTHDVLLILDKNYKSSKIYKNIRKKKIESFSQKNILKAQQQSKSTV